MRGILIDPESRLICGIEVGKGLQPGYDLIGCSVFTCVPMAGGDAIYIDDDGLFKPGLRSFMISGYPEPLFGRGLILGSNAKGNSCAPTMTFTDIQCSLKWTSYITSNG